MTGGVRHGSEQACVQPPLFIGAGGIDMERGISHFNNAAQRESLTSRVSQFRTLARRMKNSSGCVSQRQPETCARSLLLLASTLKERANRECAGVNMLQGPSAASRRCCPRRREAPQSAMQQLLRQKGAPVGC